VVVHFHPGAQELEQVREKVDVTSVVVVFVHDFSGEDCSKLRYPVLQLGI